MKAFYALFRTEAKLAIRSGDMVFFGLLFPVGVMLLLGFISGAEATALGFGGTATVGICASGLMGIPLTFAGYRHEKILKRYKVTPVSPATLLLASTLVQTIFAWASGIAVFLIARLVFGVEIRGGIGRYALTFAFVQVTIYSIGFLIASLVPNVKIANVACTVAYFPMLFLSGATVPYEVLPSGLRAVSDAFPLTQGIKLLKGAVMGLDPALDATRILVLACVAVAVYSVSLVTFRWE